MAKVAFIIADLFEDSEFQVPYDAVREAGHEALVVGATAGGTVIGKKGATAATPVGIDSVTASDIDALVMPGGYSPDKLRLHPGMVALMREMVTAGKPTAVICHAGWMLAEADVARGRRMTSYAAIRTDLVNAGADWVDSEVVTDGNLITSRHPGDLPAFTRALLEQLARTPAAR